MSERRVDVAVVGAGLAGLAAAAELLRLGRSVAVLEARERVGGRLVNGDLGGGRIVELGGQWIGPTQERAYALARELGIATFPTWTEGENAIELDGELTRYRGTIPRISPAVLADVLQAQKRLERMARRIPREAPWSARNAERLDSQTAASWMRRNVATPTGRRLFALAGRTVWGAEPRELSLLHLLFYIGSAGNLDMLLDTEGGAQQDRLVGGSQLLCTRLAERLGDALVLGAPVRRIAHSGDRVVVHSDAGSVEAGRAIVTVPPNLAGRIRYEPALPARRDQLTQRMSQGLLRKCAAVYDEPFWRADGLSGEALCDVGPVTLTFDNSPPEGSPGVLLGFVGGPEEREFLGLSARERRERALGVFVRLFGRRAARPEAFLELSWAEEEWTRGGPVCFFPTGGWTAYGPALRDPVGALHWAGTETATVWCGYMDGAITSGERAAAEAHAAL